MNKNSVQEPFVLAINIGNNLIQIGLSRHDDSELVWHVATPNALTSDEARIILTSLFADDECLARFPDFQQPNGAIIASVVPPLTDAWVQASKKICGTRPLVVGPGLKTGLRMNYNDPAEIGADRIADLVAAHELLSGAFIIVDLGTTTNFSIVDSEGVFCGGIIAPGLRVSADALSKGAARLYAVDFRAPSSIIGKSTSEALQAGIIIGEVARMDGLIEKIWDELGYETEVIAAGHGVSEIASLTKHVNRVEENLTMRGLRSLYRMNRSNKKK